MKELQGRHTKMILYLKYNVFLKMCWLSMRLTIILALTTDTYMSRG